MSASQMTRANNLTNSRNVAPALEKDWVLDRWFDLLKGERSRMPDAPVLHHYTNSFGIHGILTSNSLWATATQFSNDLSEIQYAVAIALNVVQELWSNKKRIGQWEQFLAQHVMHVLTTPLHTFGQAFIVSFCEEGDLLSQWRAYGDSSGFSLAFRSLCKGGDVRLACTNGIRTMVKRVVYDPAKQRTRVRHVLGNFIKLVNRFPFAVHSPKGAAAHLEVANLLLLELTDWACSVKHHAFSEEREWRIITYPARATLVPTGAQNFEGVLVRPTPKLLLPYMVLEPAAQKKRLPLLGIRCGPSQFQEQSARALDIQLRKTGYRNLPVTLSRVPLRV
jgi:hypothetical protein